MDKLLTSILALLMLTTANGYTQDITPLEIANKIFDADSHFNPQTYITGEYTGHPNADDIPAGTIRKFLLLTQTNEKAVVAMSLSGSEGQKLDAYLHFIKDTTWKLCAFRSLAQTNLLEGLRDEMEAFTAEDINDIIKATKKDPSRDGFTSREGYNNMLGNVRLTLELDDNIIAHFEKNKEAFNSLRDSLLTIPVNEDQLETKFEPAYKKLFLSHVYIVQKDYINFTIGGLGDNQVGYFFIKDKNDLPEMSPQDVIMLREIGGGWYLYKTT